MLQLGNSVSWGKQLNIGVVLFHNLMEIRIGTMVKELCHSYKLQM